MALNFPANGTDFYMDHGNRSVLNSLDNCTIIAIGIVRQTTSSRRWMYKSTGANGLSYLIGNPGGIDGSVECFRFRATTNTLVRTVISSVTINQAHIIAHTDGDGISPKIYIGKYYPFVKMAEAAYNTQQTGVGAPTSDAAANLQIGGRAGSNVSSGCDWMYAFVYNRILPSELIFAHQLNPKIMDRSCVLAVRYGNADILGHQVDMSPYHNNGVPGAGLPSFATEPRFFNYTCPPNRRRQRASISGLPRNLLQSNLLKSPLLGGMVG